MTSVEERVKGFVESWKLRGDGLDTKASCQVCGRDVVDGKFVLIEGVLICLDCRGKQNGKLD